MTFDGTHIHVVDEDDRIVRTILPPSSNGEAPIINTYTVPGVSFPSALAFDSPIGTRLLKSGANDIDKIYLGSSEVDAVYWGTHEVWKG